MDSKKYIGMDVHQSAGTYRDAFADGLPERR